MTRSRLATVGRVGPVSSVEITTITNTMSKSRSASVTSSASGIVASTIGTAPRSPAHDTNAISRHGIGCDDRADPDRHRARDERQQQAARDGDPDHARRDPARASAAARASRTARSGPATPRPRRTTGSRVRWGSSELPEHERGDVDRGEAGRVHAGGGAVRQQREAEDRERVEARRRQRGPAHQPGAAEADRRGPTSTPATSSKTITRTVAAMPWSATAPVEIRVTRTTVGASLSPDSASSAPTSRREQRQPAQHREDRGGVGRRGHRAEQHRRAPTTARAGSAHRRRRSPPIPPTPERRQRDARAASTAAPRASWS